MNEQQSLQASFERTNYTVYVSDSQSFIIKINTLDIELQSFLKTKNAISFAFLTAWNPHAKTIPQQENIARNQQLKMDLLDYEVYSAAGVPAGGEDWLPEESFFIINIDRKTAQLLGEKYEQIAWLYGKRSQPVELIWNKKITK